MFETIKEQMSIPDVTMEKIIKFIRVIFTISLLFALIFIPAGTIRWLEAWILIFLYLGELIEHGPAGEIFENPRHEMTREYIEGTIS